MSKPFKVHEILSAGELADLEAYAREPGRTIDECHDWLLHRQFNISRGAVGNWKQAFDEQLMCERMSGAGSMAKAFMDAARNSGGLGFSDAAALRLSQMIFEKAGELEGRGEVTPQDLASLGLGLQRVTLSKQRIEEVRAEFVEREKKALEEASKVAQSGGSAGNVVDKVRQILGLDPAPAAAGGAA